MKATGVCTQLEPLTVSVVQGLPSSQETGVPAQVPEVQRSLVVPALPSLQAEPLGSLPVHASAVSLHDSRQLASPSAPGQGLPAWLMHTPPEHESAPLQYRLSLQLVPVGAGVWLQTVPLAVSMVHGLESSQFTGMGVPAQLPDVQMSLVVWALPSLQTEPLGSAEVQESELSLHISVQSKSPSAPGHGLPEWPLHCPLLHESVPLQYRPSLQTEPLGSGPVQLF